MVQGITKYAVTVTDPQSIRFHLEKAIWLARHGRPGPVWIDIPMDVQALAIEPDALPGFEPPAAQPREPVSLAEQARHTIRCFNACERPVILVGNGVRLAEGMDALHQVIDMLQAPVLTTWKAIDFLEETHPLFAGRPGSVGQRGANFTQQNADFLLSLGARLDYGQTGYSHANFARGARKIVNDIDAAEIAKITAPIELGVAADAREFLEALLACRDLDPPRDRSGWLARSKSWQARYPVILPQYWQEEGAVNTYVLIDVLGQEMAGSDLLVPGSSGACSEITMQAFKVKKGQRIFNTEGLGAMGFGPPAALGGCLAGGGRRTICIDGDGGFHMNSQELETIRRLRLPIKFFVLNNNGYASMRTTQRNHFGGRFTASDPASGLTLPDTRKIAEACGVPALRIQNHADSATR